VGHPVYCLSIHADYACRHSGACCSTSWDVPVEPASLAAIERGITGGRLHREAPIVARGAPPGGAAGVLLRDRGGACVLFERSSRLCAVHRDLGEEALPVACRQFPRITRDDGRSTALTLSHYCPSAADLLLREDVALAVTELPAAAAPRGGYDGLRRDAWPPLLHPRMLMDADAYDRWERHAVAVFASAPTPESGLATLAGHAERLRVWRPGRGPLAGLIDHLDPAACGVVEPAADLAHAVTRHADVVACTPGRWHPETPAMPLAAVWTRHVCGEWGAFAGPLNRWLAAHAFGNWCAYQGRGLRTFVASLETALAVIAVESARACAAAGRTLDRALLHDAIRQSDFLLRHAASREALTAVWSRAEA